MRRRMLSDGDVSPGSVARILNVIDDEKPAAWEMLPSIWKTGRT
jgi:hypothetical protein